MDHPANILKYPCLVIIGMLILMTGCKTTAVNKKPLPDSQYTPAHVIYPLRDFNAWRDQAIHTETMSWRIPATVYMEGLGVQMMCFGLGKEVDEGIIPLLYSDSRMGISLMDHLRSMEPKDGPYHVWIEGQWDFEVGGYDGQMTFFIRKISPRSEMEKDEMWIGLDQ